jgi:PadR family transcriptional regulator PadR
MECHQHQHHHHHRHGMKDKYLTAALLVLISKQPSYGYDLIENLGGFGIKGMEPGKVYRYLRRLEQENLVQSQWETSESGPARRFYEATPLGMDRLRELVVVLREMMANISQLTDEAQQVLGSQDQ